jgi:hypothetical protein
MDEGTRMYLGRIIRWLAALFVVFYVFTNPSGAATLVHHAFNGLHEAAGAMATFVNAL